jgi:hypothetical protein
VRTQRVPAASLAVGTGFYRHDVYWVIQEVVRESGRIRARYNDIAWTSWWPEDLVWVDR